MSIFYEFLHRIEPRSQCYKTFWGKSRKSRFPQADTARIEGNLDFLQKSFITSTPGLQNVLQFKILIARF